MLRRRRFASLLGTLFTDRGLPPFEYVAGGRPGQRRGIWASHAWLERKGLIVDVTADQFPEVSVPVLITTDHTWHRSFKVERRREKADFRVYELPYLDRAYETITKAMQAPR